MHNTYKFRLSSVCHNQVSIFYILHAQTTSDDENIALNYYEHIEVGHKMPAVDISVTQCL